MPKLPADLSGELVGQDAILQRVVNPRRLRRLAIRLASARRATNCYQPAPHF